MTLKKLKVYIVNLKHSTKRRDNIINEVKKQNITNYKLIDAVDGNNISLEKLKSLTFKNKNNFNNWYTELTPSQIGCALSHIKIYQEFINSSYEYALILEDDSIFLNKFTYELEKFILKNFKYKKQILLLSEIKEFYFKPIDRIKDYEIVNVTNAFFTHAYIINKEAAKSIIKFNYPVKTWADNFVFFKIFCGIKLTGLNPFLVDQDKKNFKSTIALENNNEKKFFFRRSLYKIKNKIIKRFVKFSGH
tara:strand:+ start:61 stop:804 length:744 start_codon:yes stop_codon:yes gene_type:complete